jgi:hypothetical protein
MRTISLWVNPQFSPEVRYSRFPISMPTDRIGVPRGPVAQASACVFLFLHEQKSAQTEVCATKTRCALAFDISSQSNHSKQ